MRSSGASSWRHPGAGWATLPHCAGNRHGCGSIPIHPARPPGSRPPAPDDACCMLVHGVLQRWGLRNLLLQDPAVPSAIVARTASDRRGVAMGAGSKASQGALVEQCMTPSSEPLIDIGVNLVDDSFDKDRLEVIERARAAGVAAMVVTGCSLQSAAAARRLCDAVPDFPLYYTAGVHTHNAKQCDDSTLDELRDLASHERCVAIGECGLDFNRNFSPPDVQERWFAAQVRLAQQLRKPLFMHCRDAGQRFAEILQEAGGLHAPGVLHCFTGSQEELRQCLALDLHIGITGWVCDDRPERGGAELAALLPTIPPDRLMIETDAPYLVPRTIKPSKSRPGRNEPALLPHVLQQVAASVGREPEQVAQQTTRVACQFFGIPAPSRAGSSAAAASPAVPAG